MAEANDSNQPASPDSSKRDPFSRIRAALAKLYPDDEKIIQHQPSVEELLAHGIKVRDFADDLPPVPPHRRLSYIIKHGKAPDSQSEASATFTETKIDTNSDDRDAAKSIENQDLPVEAEKSSLSQPGQADSVASPIQSPVSPSRKRLAEELPDALSRPRSRRRSTSPSSHPSRMSDAFAST